jgi:hypothetical protein
VIVVDEAALAKLGIDPSTILVEHATARSAVTEHGAAEPAAIVDRLPEEQTILSAAGHGPLRDEVSAAYQIVRNSGRADAVWTEAGGIVKGATLDEHAQSIVRLLAASELVRSNADNAGEVARGHAESPQHLDDPFDSSLDVKRLLDPEFRNMLVPEARRMIRRMQSARPARPGAGAAEEPHDLTRGEVIHIARMVLAGPDARTVLDHRILAQRIAERALTGGRFRARGGMPEHNTEEVGRLLGFGERAEVNLSLQLSLTESELADSALQLFGRTAVAGGVTRPVELSTAREILAFSVLHRLVARMRNGPNNAVALAILRANFHEITWNLSQFHGFANRFVGNRSILDSIERNASHYLGDSRTMDTIFGAGDGPPQVRGRDATGLSEEDENLLFREIRGLRIKASFGNVFAIARILPLYSLRRGDSQAFLTLDQLRALDSRYRPWRDGRLSREGAAAHVPSAQHIAPALRQSSVPRGTPGVHTTPVRGFAPAAHGTHVEHQASTSHQTPDSRAISASRGTPGPAHASSPHQAEGGHASPVSIYSLASYATPGRRETSAPPVISPRGTPGRDGTPASHVSRGSLFGPSPSRDAARGTSAPRDVPGRGDAPAVHAAPATRGSAAQVAELPSDDIGRLRAILIDPGPINLRWGSMLRRDLKFDAAKMWLTVTNPLDGHGGDRFVPEGARPVTRHLAELEPPQRAILLQHIHHLVLVHGERSLTYEDVGMIAYLHFRLDDPLSLEYIENLYHGYRLFAQHAQLPSAAHRELRVPGAVVHARQQRHSSSPPQAARRDSGSPPHVRSSFAMPTQPNAGHAPPAPHNPSRTDRVYQHVAMPENTGIGAMPSWITHEGHPFDPREPGFRVTPDEHAYFQLDKSNMIRVGQRKVSFLSFSAAQQKLIKTLLLDNPGRWRSNDELVAETGIPDAQLTTNVSNLRHSFPEVSVHTSRVKGRSTMRMARVARPGIIVERVYSNGQRIRFDPARLMIEAHGVVPRPIGSDPAWFFLLERMLREPGRTFTYADMRKYLEGDYAVFKMKDVEVELVKMGLDSGIGLEPVHGPAGAGSAEPPIIGYRVIVRPPGHPSTSATATQPGTHQPPLRSAQPHHPPAPTVAEPHRQVAPAPHPHAAPAPATALHPQAAPAMATQHGVQQAPSSPRLTTGVGGSFQAHEPGFVPTADERGLVTIDGLGNITVRNDASVNAVVVRSVNFRSHGPENRRILEFMLTLHPGEWVRTDDIIQAANVFGFTSQKLTDRIGRFRQLIPEVSFHTSGNRRMARLARPQNIVTRQYVATGNVIRFDPARLTIQLNNDTAQPIGRDQPARFYVMELLLRQPGDMVKRDELAELIESTNVPDFMAKMSTELKSLGLDSLIEIGDYAHSGAGNAIVGWSVEFRPRTNRG